MFCLWDVPQHAGEAMTDSENILLAELQALRREMAAVLERQETLMSHMIRLADGHVEIAQQMMALKTALSEIRGNPPLDNLGLNNEILERRSDESNREQREPARQRRELREQWVREDREAQEQGQRDWLRTRRQRTEDTE